jgi:enoyl-CoA hydratase/carnithine racemase
VSVYQLVRHVGKGLATRMVMLGTALSAVDMQHLRMVVDVVERDELREAALTLGARLCDRERPRSLRFAKETIALAKR